MKCEAILVQDMPPSFDDERLKRLVEFFGAGCRTVVPSAFNAEFDRAEDHELCVMASASAIQKWCHGFPDATAALDGLYQNARFVFVYGFAPEVMSSSIATSLSNGAITDVRRFTRSQLRYQVSSSRPEITKEFSALSFGDVRNSTDFGFLCREDLSGVVPLVTVDGMPLLVLVERSGCKIFLLACSAIADIRERVDGNLDVTRYFSRLVPAAMFLKLAFKDRIWHNKHRVANFIFDDPTLKPSYGYLNYRDLICTMDRTDFASTIAFIPWNYKRTDPGVSELFRQRPDRLSLCVHGCDHTAAEFSTTDLVALNSRVELASARMESLQRRDGLSYSKTMVFPQGRFSSEALTVLKCHNYLAAVNSSASTEASGAAPSLTIADVLQPAVMNYGGFPLFLRRYPDRLEQFAFDLFFGKPLLIVEHHGFLRDGGTRLADFISRLNSFENLRWSRLDEIMAKSYLEREISSEIVDFRAYTSRNVIENHAEHKRRFKITKFEPGGIPVQQVLINGRPTEFMVRGDQLRFTIDVPAFSCAVVNIIYKNALPRVQPAQGFATRTRVWTRRMLSEFRDNVLCRNHGLLSGAQAVQRGLSAWFTPPPINPN
jgi:hypothetical protein